jgi:CRP-like cAMP-binding protein
MTTFLNLKANYLLGTLAPLECANFRNDLELVEVQAEQYLDEPHAPLAHVYFPTTCIVSLMCLTEDGLAVEVGLVGREGMVGTSFTGAGVSPVRAMVQHAGVAYRLKTSIFKREFHNNIALQRASFRYTRALLTQVAQSALCNRCHSVDQHLCRWLLDSLDRLSSNELAATHESIANRLGVRRESITAAAGKLKAAGTIRSHRGHITVIDRDALEERVCECYQIVKNEFQDLLTPDNTVSYGDRKEVHYRTAIDNRPGTNRISSSYQRRSLDIVSSAASP